MAITDIKQLLPQDIYDAAIGANSPSASNVFATVNDLVGGGGIYGGSGSLSIPNTTVTGGGNSLFFSGLGSFSVTTTGSGLQFADTDAGVGTAELSLLGTGFGTGVILRYSDAVQGPGGGDQSIELGGNVGIGGTGMIVTDSGDLKGLMYAADYSAAGVLDPRWIPDYGAVQALVGANNEWSEVLSNGAASGGTNPVLTSGDVLISSSGTMRFDPRFGGVDNQLFIGHDPVGYTGLVLTNIATGPGEGLYLGYDNIYIDIRPNSATQNLGLQNGPIFVAGSGPNVQIVPGGTTANVALGHESGSFAGNVNNSVIAGGSNIAATVDDTLYANNLRLQAAINAFDGHFNIGILTASQTYTFQDESGEVPVGPGWDTLIANPTATEDGYVIKWNDTANEYQLVADTVGIDTNIYNSDGTLTANRTLTGAFDLNINNSGAFRRTGDFVFAEGANRQLYVEQSTGLAGYDLTISAGDAANGLGTGGDLILNPGAGGTTPGGSAGDIFIQGLAGNGNATGSTVYIDSGDSPNNGGGDILVVTGNGGGPGAGGDFSITTGTGVARGSIIFVDGSEGTIGDVWTSSGVGGQGTWSTPATVATGQTWTDPTNLPGIPVRGGYDANATTIDELADVLGQLIVDLRTTDILN